MPNRKLGLLLGTLSFLFACSDNQSAGGDGNSTETENALNVRVVDAQGSPVQGAWVTVCTQSAPCANPVQGDSTDATGIATFTQLPEGTYGIAIAWGENSVVRSVVWQGETTLLDNVQVDSASATTNCTAEAGCHLDWLNRKYAIASIGPSSIQLVPQDSTYFCEDGKLVGSAGSGSDTLYYLKSSDSLYIWSSASACLASGMQGSSTEVIGTWRGTPQEYSVTSVLRPDRASETTCQAAMQSNIAEKAANEIYWADKGGQPTKPVSYTTQIRSDSLHVRQQHSVCMTKQVWFNLFTDRPYSDYPIGDSAATYNGNCLSAQLGTNGKTATLDSVTVKDQGLSLRFSYGTSHCAYTIYWDANSNAPHCADNASQETQFRACVEASGFYHFR